MPPRRKGKKKPKGLRPVLTGFMVGAVVVGAIVAFLFWPRHRPVDINGLSRDAAARVVAKETERLLSHKPLSSVGQLITVDFGINIPWTIVWRGRDEAAVSRAEQSVRDAWGAINAPPRVKVIYPDHSKRGERARLVASSAGRPLVEVLLLQDSEPLAQQPAPPKNPPRNPKPPKNPTPVSLRPNYPPEPLPDRPPSNPGPPDSLPSIDPPANPPANPSPLPPPSPEPEGRGRIAIIIDDIGNDRAVVEKLLALPAPITFAVMPYSRYSGELAKRISASGAQVMLHLPMEPQDLADNDPGPGALLLSMTPSQIDAALGAALARVPMARGLNNHMGSAFTSDGPHMQALLQSVSRRGLYFIDSRTSNDSFGPRLMRQMGVPGAERRVFLDHVASQSETEARMAELARAAGRGGVPIGIGHPYPETVAALTRIIPRMIAEGYVFVPASEAIR